MCKDNVCCVCVCVDHTKIKQQLRLSCLIWIAQTPLKTIHVGYPCKSCVCTCCLPCDPNGEFGHWCIVVYRVMISYVLVIVILVESDNLFWRIVWILLIMSIWIVTIFFTKCTTRDDINMTMERSAHNLVLAGVSGEIEDLTFFGANIDVKADGDVLNQKVSGKDFGLGYRQVTPVLFAVIKGDIVSLKWLLKQGVNVGFDALMVGSQYHQAKIIDFLLGDYRVNEESLFNVNDQSSKNNTTLLMAAMQNDTFASDLRNYNAKAQRDTLKILINKYNADLNLQDKDGDTALMVGLKEIIRLCLMVDKKKIHKMILTKVEILLSVGKGKIDLNIQNNKGGTAVIYAAKEGLNKVLEILKNHGADFKITDKDGHNALNMATNELAYDTVNYLLDEKIFDINEKDKVNGETPLIIAMKKITLAMAMKKSTLMKWLRRSNEDEDSFTSLHAITLVGSKIDKTRMLNMLLNVNNIDVNVINNNGDTAFMVGAAQGNDEGLGILVSKAGDKIDFNVRNNNGENVAMCVAKAMIFDDINANDTKTVEMLKLLRQHNVDFKIKDNYGNSLLSLAVMKSKSMVIEYLLNENLVDNVNDADNNGDNAAMKVVHVDDDPQALTILKLLRHHNADVNIREGNALLLRSMIRNNEKVIKYLLSEKLTDVNDVSHHGNSTELMIDTQETNIEILKLLLFKACDTIDYVNYRGEPACMEAIHCSRDEARSVQVLKLLTQYDCNLNARDNNGNTLLLTATCTPNVLAVEYLLDKKLVSVNETNNDNSTALTLAVKNRHNQEKSVEILKLLKRYNADFNVRDDEGNTLLLCAAQEVNWMVIEYLLNEKLANVNEVNEYGETALMQVMSDPKDLELKKVEKTFYVLFHAFNADPNITNDSGKTALMIGVNAYEARFGTVRCFISVCGNSIDYDIKCDGKSALDMARNREHNDIVRLLYKKQATK